jgi:hypothetical protein
MSTTTTPSRWIELRTPGLPARSYEPLNSPDDAEDFIGMAAYIGLDTDRGAPRRRRGERPDPARRGAGRAHPGQPAGGRPARPRRRAGAT